MNKVIKFSNFQPNAWGHGGEKRTAQIQGILQSVVSLEHGDFFEPNEPKIQRLLNGLKNIDFKSLAEISSIQKLKTTINYFAKEEILKKQLKPLLQDKQLILWENTTPELAFIPKIAEQCNTKIIALPHNLESLVPTQKYKNTNLTSPEWFKQEIEYLRKCDAVFTISREEQWLLAIHGVDAGYLPYYPPLSVEIFLKEIKTRRLEVEVPKSKFLMLGTAGNPPTYQGMLNRIQFFAKELPELELLVAGYATESLSKEIQSKNISFLGEITTAKLTDILSTVKGVIIHQAASSGALTKIPEFLIAGVPIISNSKAARNYFNIKGVHVYENDDEFCHFIHTKTLAEPEVWDKPIVEEARFKKCILSNLS